MTRRLVIAIDGPAGAGKSSAARLAAERLGYRRIDTGALYRAVAWIARVKGVSWDDEEALGSLTAATVFAFETPKGTSEERVADPVLRVDGAPVADALRTDEISEGASIVSRHPAVRQALLAVQRALGAEGGVVLEGRDIGTVVFPDADVKVFLTAAPEVRAKRRYLEQQGGAGPVDTACVSEASPTLEDTLRQLEARDRRDSVRAISPLRSAPGAMIIDGTNLTLDEVVGRIVVAVQEALARQGGPS